MQELFATAASGGHQPSTMPRISVLGWNRAFQLLDPESAALFARLTGPGSPLGRLLSTDDGYKLTTLTAAFGFSQRPALKAVAQRYVRALKRRLSANANANAEDVEKNIR